MSSGATLSSKMIELEPWISVTLTWEGSSTKDLAMYSISSFIAFLLSRFERVRNRYQKTMLVPEEVSVRSGPQRVATLSD
jgi:hypothetical protein